MMINPPFRRRRVAVDGDRGIDGIPSHGGGIGIKISIGLVLVGSRGAEVGIVNGSANEYVLSCESSTVLQCISFSLMD